METYCGINLETIPKELKLLIEIISAKDYKCEPTQRERFLNIDWDLFLELAVHHRIYPLLASKIKHLDKSLIPLEIIRTAEKLYKFNTFQMLHLSGEMERVTHIFSENQIKTLLLKGPILGWDLYGDISLRTSGDLDILIPIEDLDKVDRLLFDLGYAKDEYIQTVLNDWTWRHHHVTYFNPQEKIKIEIHWRLNPGPGWEPSFNELWERKRSGLLTNNPIYYLGREDLFLFLVSHGARHGWSRLRWLIDIKKIVGQDINWETLKVLLKKHHYLRVGGQALYLASSLFNTTISSGMREIIDEAPSKKLAQSTIFYMEKMINLHSVTIPEEVALYHKKYLFSTMTLGQRLLFIMSFLYPYPEDAEFLPLPKYLHFLYFPLRPFLWLWRKTKNHALV
ncbi:nucleotidyltransferase family protein [Mesobacillus foraminis]|uniref:nucleotidyltransferase domain-containing protein n=1 Tax=Mesobacillus foraminis TaxID=279826 RepID=UPI001BEB200D|nr:nucleotidyltransferase family protein [Mesobacillus foraminis]MBT2758426.1 nucleotidyltransferase family protein [Mesobacillus foraminis]